MSPAIASGYAPGLLGWCVAEHGTYYAAEWGFGPYFETKVAAEMADFVRRLDDPGNHIFRAEDGHGFLATVSLDGGDAEDGLAHLRWFIACDRARGRGVGHALLQQTCAAARRDGAMGIFLWTFAGLDAARKLYEHAGFSLVREVEDNTWGTPVREQRFELRF